MRLPALLLLACLNGAAIASCPEPTAGPADIRIGGYYSDAAKSVRDPDKFKATRAASKPFEDFASVLSKQSDEYLADGDKAAAACAIRWLERWAQDGAMLGEMQRIDNDQSEYMRKWTNATAAIAWNKVRGEADEPTRTRIDAWLKAVSRATLAYWSDNPKKTRNNHYYWTGVGVAATAVASDDAELLGEARRIFEAALDDIQNDGSLPHELKRGQRALHYHNFSAMPLVMMAEMARKSGQDWFSLREARLDLLMRRIAEGLRDPAWFEAQAGSQQLIPPMRDRVWIVLYRAHASAGETFAGLFDANEKTYSRSLGGSTALLLDKQVFAAR